MIDYSVLDTLMDVFNSARYGFLTLDEVTRQLQRRGIYTSVDFHKAMAAVLNHLCFDRTRAAYPFLDIEREGQTLWGLESWIEKPARPIRHRMQSVDPLPVGWEARHLLSPGGSEINKGFYPLRGQNADRIIASMDEWQREHSVVELRCYGSERLMCALAFDERDNRILRGQALKNWYQENGVEPGDTIWLNAEAVRPLALRIYTEWERDADAYRRYVQRRKLETLSITDLPVRDLVWLFFQRTGKVAHRSEVARTVLAERPDISERSIDACLSGNRHLFERTGERGNWGLKEWGIEQVNMAVRSRADDTRTTPKDPLPTRSVSLDYVLANIAAEDLVYRILKGAQASLSESQITQRIAQYLSVDESVLKRASFLDVTESRLVRLHDGTFALREDLEEVVSELTVRNKDLKWSLHKAEEDVARLREELEMTSVRVIDLSARARQMESERDEARNWARVAVARHVQLEKRRREERTLLGQVLSTFLKALVVHINRPTLDNVFDLVRREFETSRAREEDV